MSASIRVLIVQNRQTDVDRIVEELRQAGFDPEWQRIDSEAEFEAHLHRDFDIILANYRLPQFKAPRALELLRAQDLDIPFIIVTDKTHEKAAAACLKQGAADYLITDRLLRLGEAVRRAIHQRHLRLEWRQAEISLRESEEKFKAIFRQSQDVIIIIDGTNGQILDLNPAAHPILGYAKERLIGSHFSVLFPPDPGQPEPEFVSKLFAPGTSFETQEFLRADGMICLMDLAAAVIPRGQDEAILVTLRQITDSRQAREARQESEQQIHQIISSISDHIYVTEVDADGNYVYRYISPNIETLTGYSREQFMDDWHFWPSTVVHPYDKHLMVAKIAQWVIGQDSELEYRIVRADGEVSWVRDSARVRDEGQARIIYGVVCDVTKRYRQEQQRRQAQEMEAIGRLAGGVAHDFNNILTAIVGYTDFLLLHHSDEADPLRKDIEQVKKAVVRAASLTRQLLTLSRRQKLQLQPLDLNAIVADLEQMLRRLIGDEIELTTLLDPALGRVKGDWDQLEQTLLNLVMNARDAMPEGGKLTIETANVYLDEANTQNFIDLVPGSYVMLAVTDTGIGMDQETQSRIFEPFFTAKEMVRSTGLGLATSYVIVKQSGGHIWVHSEPDQGATFKLYLPRVDEATDFSDRGPASEGSKSELETILLMEGEEIVQDLAQRILLNYGYTVLTASNSTEALRICERYSGPIHLLVSDMAMLGGISGPGLNECLIKRRPKVKLLYLSGYTDDPSIPYASLDKDASFLEKPFTPDDFARKVRQVLDRPPGA